MKLDFDAILKTEDLPKAEVDIPQWGGSVTVRALTAEEAVHIVQECRDNPIKFQRAVLCACCSEWATPEQIDIILKTKSAVGVAQLTDACLAQSGLAEDMEQLAGN